MNNLVFLVFELLVSRSDLSEFVKDFFLLRHEDVFRLQIQKFKEAEVLQLRDLALEEVIVE